MKGFGGVGALLRFQLDVSTLDYDEEYCFPKVTSELTVVTTKSIMMIDSKIHLLLG